MSSFDDYFAGIDDDAARAALQHVREVVAAAEPTAEEGTSYGMPAFRLSGKPLLGVTSAKQHLSVFPFSPAVVEAVSPRLEGFGLSKGTIRFTVDAPIPDDVLRDMVALRRSEIL